MVGGYGTPLLDQPTMNPGRDSAGFSPARTGFLLPRNFVDDFVTVAVLVGATWMQQMRQGVRIMSDARSYPKINN